MTGFLSGGYLPGSSSVTKIANQQLGYGQQVQGLNAPPQSGVFGQTNYAYNPQGGIAGVNTSLNPQFQGVANTLLGGLGTQPGDVSKAVYGQYQANLDPQWQ